MDKYFFSNFYKILPIYDFLFFYFLVQEFDIST